MVIPVDDSSEPCYEHEAIQLFREIRERARQGDLDWLRQHGTVYEAIEPIEAPDERPECPASFVCEVSQGANVAEKRAYRSQLGGRYGLLTHAEKKLGIKTRAIKSRV